MEKLKLRDLSVYLPYGLNGLDELKQRVKIIGFKNETYFIESGNVNAYGDILSLVPILRPLSDITKNITINEITFIPIKKLNEHIGFYNSRFIDYDDGESKNTLHFSFFDVYFESLEFDKILEIQNKLLEWHFDIYGLIDKGLAIDINTIK